MSRIIFKNGPSIKVSFIEEKIQLETHEEKGMICSVPESFLPWLEAYSHKQSIPLPLLPPFNFPAFTQQVLHQLTLIPWGETRTYSEIAPHAPRAVGTACRNNPFPLLIPCHRVVAAQGLGGFSQGLEVKKRLLNHESGTDFASSPSNRRNSYDRDRDFKKNSRTRIHT